MRSPSNNKDLVIRATDKGGGVMLQDLEDYQKEAFNILSDTTYYKIIPGDPFPKSEKRILQLY